jgi:deoxyadenosine/deoxycytidine kinase
MLNQKKPIVLSVEGIIGVGKSSIIEHCLIPLLTSRGWKVTLIEEPVNEWKEILPLFYKDPSRWAYHFQTMAFHDRVRESQDKWENYKDNTDIFITERSVYSDPLFMKTLYERGNVTDLEMKNYIKWWSLWKTVLHFNIDMFIYLTPTIEETMRRVRLRSREGEEGVSIDYQLDLLKQHENFFGSGIVMETIPVHKLDTDSDFKTDSSVKNNIIDIIENKIINIVLNPNY